jgi:hypothetical protein
MFTFLKREPEVLDHWISMADEFHVSSDEFYKAIETELARRQIPQLKMERIEISEGGLISGNRIYLRMMRERLLFDVCAAPFGTSYFFSCRSSELPLNLNYTHILLMLMLIFGSVSAQYYLFLRLTGSSGLAWTCTAGLIGLIVYFLRNLVALGFQDLDSSLVRVPGIGPIYEYLFRRQTYYRHDTRLCYIHIVKTVVRKHADAVVGAKGIKLTGQFERAPILGELYRPVHNTVAHESGPALAAEPAT